MLLRTHLIAKSNWRQSTGSLQKTSWAQLFSGNKLFFDVCPHLQKYSQEVWNLSSASPDIDCLINCTSIRTTFVQNVATYWVKTESIAVTFVMEIPQPTVRTHYFFFFWLISLSIELPIDFVIFASSLYLDWLYNRLLQPCRVRPPSRPVCGPLWQLPRCWPWWRFNDKLVTSRGAGDMVYRKAYMTWNEFMNFSIWRIID
jgi:hypothetical protein